MKHHNITSTSKIAREQMIQMLNKDLASEYQAIIAFIVYSEVLRRASHTEIAQELELHAAEDFQHAKQIAKQIDYLGGVQCVKLDTVETPDEPVAMLLSSISQNLDDETNLAALLGIELPQPAAPGKSSAPRPIRTSPTSPRSVAPDQSSARRNTAKRSARNTGAWAMLQPA